MKETVSNERSVELGGMPHIPIENNLGGMPHIPIENKALMFFVEHGQHKYFPGNFRQIGCITELGS